MLPVEPIGVVHSPFTERKAAPRQARAAADARAVIELFAGHGYEDALSDVESWSHLWIVSWFHHNDGWRPRVRPPRSDEKRGVFATRAPHRPNPIGLSVVRLERVEGLRVHVCEIDLLDGTPVLDIKPYLAWADAIEDAGDGWLRPEDPRPGWEVVWTDEARVRADWLREHGVDVEAPMTDVLVLGPQPHAYRRIKPDGDGMRLAWESWRARFEIDGRTIRVVGVCSGYRPRQIHEGSDAELDVHRRFVERFGWG